MVLSYPMCLFFLSDILFKFKMDARVQDVTEGILHATIIFYSDADALYSQLSMSYEWSSFSGGNVECRREFRESEMMNLIIYGSLRFAK